MVCAEPKYQLRHYKEHMDRLNVYEGNALDVTMIVHKVNDTLSYLFDLLLFFAVLVILSLSQPV